MPNMQIATSRSQFRPSFKNAGNRNFYGRGLTPSFPTKPLSWPLGWLSTLTHAAQVIEHEHNGRLVGLTLTHKRTRWLATIRVRFSARHLVGFVTAPNLRDLLFIVGHDLKNKQVKWRPSKYGGN